MAASQLMNTAAGIIRRLGNFPSTANRRLGSTDPAQGETGVTPWGRRQQLSPGANQHVNKLRLMYSDASLDYQDLYLMT